MTNEWYAKDISKKRKIVNKMKGNAGIPLSQPPYGYIKNPDDSRFWVIDPEAADVVRRIYDMALEGYGLAEIANALGVDGIVNPTYYWRSKGVNRSGSKSTLEPTKWGHTTIKKILTLQEVAGHETVDGGRRRCPYRPYPCPAALRPVWIMPQTNTTRRALPLHAGGRGKGGISF